MRTHVLKCWPRYFARLKDGSKTFEARINDRDFQKGDRLVIRRYDPANPEGYSDNPNWLNVNCEELRFDVSYVMHSEPSDINAIMPGYVVMALDRIEGKGK